MDKSLTRAFFFVFQVKPTAAAEQASDIAEGLAHVWVMDAAQPVAESRARALVMDMGWVITALEHALRPSAEQIARLDTAESANHRRALARGTSIDLIVWPKTEQPEGTAELRSLKFPTGDGTKH